VRRFDESVPPPCRLELRWDDRGSSKVSPLASEVAGPAAED